MIEGVADQRRIERDALAVCQRAVTVHQRQGSVGVERRQATLEKLRRPDVVGVEKGEVLARRIARAVVARCCRPAVCLLDQTHAVAVFSDDGESAVSRAVVNANYFEILKGLRDDAIDGAGDSRRRIVGRNNYRNARHCLIGLSGGKQMNARWRQVTRRWASRSTGVFYTSPFGRGRASGAGEDAGIELDARALTRRERTRVDLSRRER